MIAEVVDNAFDSAAVEEVAVGVRELRFEDRAHAPAGNCVGQGESENANDGSKQVAKRRSIQYIADEE
jgi:hypothetical protein